MKPRFFLAFQWAAASIAAAAAAWQPASAAPSHGIAMYGEPGLRADFVSLPYANPDAPKGGRVVTGNVGSFDSLNPYALKGDSPWQLRFLTHESLMGRSRNEPFTLYGLLAESIETPADRKWVEFTLRREAAFSDGSPVTVDDVIWSFETLGTQGHPRYRSFWKQVERIEATGPRSVRLSFLGDNRELALIAGLRPILKKAQWEGRDFADSKIEDIPLGSSPYVVDDYRAGRYVSLKRNPNYWGRNLPLRRGVANFDEIRIEFYGDSAVLHEAFKAKEVSYVREFNAERWATQYDFPAVRSGEIVKSEIPDQKPTGITGFVMNTRRAPLDDWRVRDALIHAFNFEYINDALTGGRQPRITSYFSNSLLGMLPGPAKGRVRELLEPFAGDLPPGALEGYVLPRSDGTQRNRGNIRKALALLSEAGLEVQDGVLRDAQGNPVTFNVLLRQDALLSDMNVHMDIYAEALKRLGITLNIETADSAQFKAREKEFDFDITFMRRALSLSPGNEQRSYWGAESAGVTGSRNLMGLESPAVDAMIDAMLAAKSREEFTSAVRALDRILISGRYVIPIHQYSIARIAHLRELRYPADRLPIYGDGVWFLPEVWWHEE